MSEQRTQRRPQPDSGQVDDRIDVRIVSRYIRCSATKSDARRRSVSWLGTANPMFSSDDSQTRCHVDHRHLHMTARTLELPQCRYGCRLDHHLQHRLQEDQQTHERRTSVYVRRTPLIGGRVFFLMRAAVARLWQTLALTAKAARIRSSSPRLKTIVRPRMAAIFIHPALERR